MKPTIQFLKVCGKCKKQWKVLPEKKIIRMTGELDQGIWFDCECKSTLFVPLRKAEKKKLYEKETT